MTSASCLDLAKLTLAIIFAVTVTSPLTPVDATPADDQADSGGKKQIVRVTTIEERPYVIKKRNTMTNSDFEGYIPDLLSRLAAELKFDYTIHLVADGKYGGELSNGQWSGMIGELLNGKADLAAAAITVSDKRLRVVDFTRPFMTFDYAILMKKPTGNSTTSQSIKSLTDLVNQNVISYGVIRDGVTESYFRSSTASDIYQQMWRHMSAGDGTGVSDAKEGVRRVREMYDGRPYAFITESSSADFWVNEQPCDLLSVPIQISKRSYALALKKNWSMGEPLNATLTQMEQSGELGQLRNKWWMTGACNSGGPGSGGRRDVTGLRWLLQLFMAIFVVALPTRLVGKVEF